MVLQESGEMYLETIYILSQESQFVRSVDVAQYMGYSKPSVSRAISRLKEDDYVRMDENGFLFLTEKGHQVAETIYERHVVLTKCLKKLGVAEPTASEDACRIEHVISPDSFEAIKAHIRKRLE